MHTWNWAVPRYCCRNWHSRRQCFFPDHSLWEDAESCLKQQQKLTLESFPSKPFGLQFWIQCFGFPKLNAGTTQEVLLWSCLDKSGEVWSLINLYATQHQGTRPDSAQAGRQYFIQRSDKNSELAGVLLPLGKKPLRGWEVAEAESGWRFWVLQWWHTSPLFWCPVLPLHVPYTL